MLHYFHLYLNVLQYKGIDFKLGKLEQLTVKIVLFFISENALHYFNILTLSVKKGNRFVIKNIYSKNVF